MSRENRPIGRRELKAQLELMDGIKAQKKYEETVRSWTWCSCGGEWEFVLRPGSGLSRWNSYTATCSECKATKSVIK